MKEVKIKKAFYDLSSLIRYIYAILDYVLFGIKMDVELQLSSSKLREDSLDKLTRDLKKTLDHESDINAKIPTGPSEKGMKGEPITIGLLILTFISSGAAVALFNVLKSYFERDSTLEVSLKKADGTEIRVNSKNIQPDQMAKTMNSMNEFLGRSQ